MKIVVKEVDGRRWTGFIWLRIGTGADGLGFRSVLGISLAEQLFRDSALWS